MKNALTLTTIKRACGPILRSAGVNKASVFGSFARGDARKSSDVDFLIVPPSGFGLLELVGLRDSLKHALKRDVDIVTERSLHPAFKKTIHEQEVRIV